MVALSVSACLLSLYTLRTFHSLGLAMSVRYSANLYPLSALAKADERSAVLRTTQQSATFNLCMLV